MSNREPVRLVETSDIAPLFLRYVRSVLGELDAQYAEAPTRFSAGVENQVFALRLAGVRELRGPLVLKVYAAYADAVRVQREAIAQNEVAAQGFPAPRVLHVCEARDVLGAPFLIMECLPGDVMLGSLDSMHPSILQTLRVMPETVLRMPSVIGTLLGRLHQLDPRPLVDHLESRGILGDLAGLEGRLRRLAPQVDEQTPPGFADAMRWLIDHRPEEPRRQAICHGDMWFGNVLEQRGTVSGVVDWSAELLCIGDPMYDLGVATAILKFGMADVPGPLRVLARCLQGYVASRVLRAYGREQPIDRARLRYYELLRCVEFLSWVSARRVDASRRTRQEREDMLEVVGSTEQFIRHVWKMTGITLEVPKRLSAS